jgi:hypothetical protein
LWVCDLTDVIDMHASCQADWPTAREDQMASSDSMENASMKMLKGVLSVVERERLRVVPKIAKSGRCLQGWQPLN